VSQPGKKSDGRPRAPRVEFQDVEYIEMCDEGEHGKCEIDGELIDFTAAEYASQRRG
jgi:hypothetical protein